MGLWSRNIHPKTIDQHSEPRNSLTNLYGPDGAVKMAMQGDRERMEFGISYWDNSLSIWRKIKLYPPTLHRCKGNSRYNDDLNMNSKFIRLISGKYTKIFVCFHLA